ncbi:MAG TPA: CHAT domain-containing tetratricopeptide repeat protein [Thermoanaerobaculia bacterium]|nr:CHAT domain-containing tetratricopeptide repeat protein [Thermoanaerobaculia bacterium]
MLKRICVCVTFALVVLSASADVALDVAMVQGQTHEERFDFPANHFVTILAEQYDIGLEAKVLDPAGREIVRGVLEYDTRVSFITRDGGTHRLVLEPMPQASRLGTVHVALLVSRPATEKDAQRLEAQRTFFDGGMLLRNSSAIDAARAIPLFERALKQWRDVGDCRGEMWTLTALGIAYGSKADNARSIEHFRAALALQRELGDARAVSRTLVNLGHMMWRADPAGARAVLLEALVFSRTIGHAEDEADAQNYLGVIEYGAGEHRAAIVHYEHALAVLQQHAGNPQQQAFFTQNIAVSLAGLGEWRQSLNYFHRAAQLYEMAGHKGGVALVLQNLGAAYGWLGEHHDALVQFRRALPLAREVGNRSMEGMNRIHTGVSLLELGDVAEARASLEEGLAIALAIEDLRMQALALRHLGRLEDKERRHRPALAYHEQSLIRQQAVGNRRGEGFALLNIGTLQRKLGDPEAARRSIREAHAIACAFEDQGLDSATRLALARVEAGEGRFHEAWRQLEAALQGVESLRVNVAGQHLRGSFQLTLSEYYELAVDVLMRMDRPADALEISERARARGLLDLLGEAQVDVRAGGDPQLLAREKELRRSINDKAAQLARAAKTGPLTREVDALVAELRRIESRIRASSPRYAALMQPEMLTLREIQRDVLDEDTLLVEIALGAERSYVWSVTTGGVTSRALPPRKDVEAIARRFYETLTERNTVIDGETAQARLARLAKAKTRIARDGARLYQLLLARLPLKGKKRLLVVADGALHYVPFAAIPIDGQPLITRFEIVHMPSVSSLAALRRETVGRRVPARSVAVLADPVFADARMPRLPLAREEATSIARIAHRADVRLGYEATRAAAMSGELRDFRYIHFATHGVIDDRNPELSGIVLSLVDERGNPQDGFLRLHDIYNLDLQADLVVLSACRTALGKEVAHEGLVGLTRGFLYAGAERVLASLWKIDDRATAELMRRFYERMLVDRMTPAAALRAVQLEMARSPRWSEPYHWAAFVLQGEWRP